jgi:hypothetical protein
METFSNSIWGERKSWKLQLIIMKLLSLGLSSLLFAGSAVASSHKLNAFKKVDQRKPQVEKREPHSQPEQPRLNKRTSSYLTPKTQRMYDYSVRRTMAYQS